MNSIAILLESGEQKKKWQEAIEKEEKDIRVHDTCRRKLMEMDCFQSLGMISSRQSKGMTVFCVYVTGVSITEEK